MAQLINEAKRMQLLAGIITESEANEPEKTNELFGLGTPSPKPGTRVTINYSNVDSKYGSESAQCMVLQNGSWQLEDTRDYLNPYKEGHVFTYDLLGLGAEEDNKQILKVGDKLKSGGVVKSIVMGNKSVEKIKINYKK